MRDAEIASTREVVALFKGEDALQGAIDELLSSGFDRAELSLLASEDTLRATFGDRFRTSAELEDVDAVPRSTYCSVESLGDAQGGLIGGLVCVGAVAATGLVIVSGGALAGAVGAAILAGGAAGAVGVYLAHLLGDARARHVAEHLEHGGLLMWVRTWDDDDERRAISILRTQGGTDVHVHGSRSTT